MKQLFVLLLFQIIGLGVTAQLSPCDSANLDCSLDLTQPIFTDIHIDTLSYAKKPLPGLFLDVKYKDDVYGKPVTCSPPDSDECLNDGSALIYYVYYPKDHNYKACPLKPIILMHAGGFAECSNLDQPGINNMAVFLAQKGFVVFNVEYRRGIVGDRFTPSNTTAQQQLAPYRAEQDIHGFFRSMIKRERNKSSFPEDNWRIDTNNVFIGGMSAGAFTALNVAWYTDAMTYSLYAPPIASGNIQAALGSPDVDFYYGEPDFDFHDFYQPKIKGVCSLWGAVPMPYAAYHNINNQPAFFTDAHLTPAILFHGYLDETFPLIDRDPPYSQKVNLSPNMPADELPYNSVKFCIRNSMGPFSVNNDPKTVDVINGSSYNIYRILTSYGIRSEIYVDCSMAHGLDADCGGCSANPSDLTKNRNCKACFYGSNFGTNAVNQVQTEAYMASRIAVFFQKILHPPAYYGNTVFVDCENTSKKCDTTTNCTNRSCSSTNLFP